MRRSFGPFVMAMMFCVFVLSGCNRFNETVMPCVKNARMTADTEVQEDPQGRARAVSKVGISISFGGKGCPEVEDTGEPGSPPDDDSPLPVPGEEDQDTATISLIGQGVSGTIADLRIDFPWVDIYSVDVGINGIIVEFGGTTDSQTMQYDLQRALGIARNAGFSTTVTHRYSQDLTIHTYER